LPPDPAKLGMPKLAARDHPGCVADGIRTQLHETYDHVKARKNRSPPDR
jgi:hypothetical protein